MTSSASGQLTIGDTFGAMFIGTLVTMTIYGITTLQVYFYYLSFPKDGLPTRSLVFSIWILDTLHSIFMCHSVHSYLIDGFGNPAALVNGNWSLFTSILINVFIAFIVQCFFTNRILRLSSPRWRYWVAGVIGFLVFAHFVFGIETVAYLFKKKEFSRLHELSLTSVVPFGATTVLSDILIAIALCTLLDRNRSGFDDTNLIINRLIIYAINRCILISCVAILETILFSVMPNSFYTFAIDFVIGKLYANSLLAVLNARANLRPGHIREDMSSTEMSTGLDIARSAHPTSLIQVRTRDTSRRPANVDDEEKGDQDFTSSAHSRRDDKRLDPGVDL